MTGVMAKPVSAQSAQRCRYKHLPTPSFPPTCLLRTCYCLALIPSISLEYPDTLLLCSCYGPATLLARSCYFPITLLLISCYYTATLLLLSLQSPATLLTLSCQCPVTVLRLSCESPVTLLVLSWCPLACKNSHHQKIPAPPAQTTGNGTGCTGERAP